jgi:probable 2-oxoglutarate dehydrogenase E1 component DHKTD1
LEKFLQTKFATFKRYSGEGTNTLLVMLYSLLSECSRKSSEVENVILSMPHRGRLCILPLILDYPVKDMLSKIQGNRDMPEEIEGIDDVVSHIATSNSKTFCLDGNLKEHKAIQISLLHNPSHLEAINPAGMGKAYAKIQDYEGNNDKVLNLVIHGDAALSAQGVIYETLSFHRSPLCDVGGTIHIVTNNQIGYTTQGANARSSQHTSDIFKAYDIPIIHVNADDVDTVIKVARLAYNYRKEFKKDIIIDLIGWRKHGHNEVDEPMFTQPNMYKTIKNKTETVDSFKKRLTEENIMSEEQVKAMADKFAKILDDEFNKSKEFKLTVDDVRNENYKGNKSLTHKWKNLQFPQFCKSDEDIKTGINIDDAKKILKASATLPSDFKVHPRLSKYFIGERLNNVEKGIVDWPGAEMIAFGSLLKDGYNIRLSGQDVTRGTFSQRHIGLFDQETNQVYHPFKNPKNINLKGRLEVSNSSLSELAVMLFDYGYSLENPNNFVMWEAQFGDFVNGAQIAQDQFLASGEKKWMRQSSLTLLLPHGFDGTGPEHSS